MASLKDHLRRDAEHAARAQISLVLDKYKRRVYEQALANISTAIAEAGPADALDGEAIGKAAAIRGFGEFLSTGTPQEALEAPDDPEEG